MIGADIIAEMLQARGLKRIYVFPGGTIAPVLDSVRNLGIEIFCPRNEQGAGYAAIAAARLTRKAQAVMVTSGPGVTNVVTAVADAYYDSTPLVVFTGQVGTGDLRGEKPVRQRGFQEINTVSLMQPITKAALLVIDVSELATMVANAFTVAEEGRPGPVIVDLPMNVQRADVELIRQLPLPDQSHQPQPDSKQICEMSIWLVRAERPVILAGQGVIQANACAELRQLSAWGEIPVAMSMLGTGAFPSNSSLCLGMPGHTGTQYANRSIHEADFLLAVGTRLDVRQTGNRVSEFVPHGKVVRIDLDPAELAYSRVPYDMGIQADARQALQALLQALPKRSPVSRSTWLAQIAAWKAEYPLEFDLTCGRLKPQQVIEAVDRLTCGREVVVTTGVGCHQQWTVRHFTFDYPRRVLLTSAGHGAMGFDLPAAIGAQLARPDALVLCVVGDGSLQMNIQELATVVEHKLPIKIVVIDNKRLALVSQFQLLNWGSDPATGGKHNPNFARIAAAYGLKSFYLDNCCEVDQTIKHLLAESGPALLHCVVDEKEDVVPMLLAGQTMDKMWPYA